MVKVIFCMVVLLLSAGYSDAGSNLDVDYIRKQLREGFVKKSFNYYTGAVDVYREVGKKPDLNDLLGIGEAFMSSGCVEKALKVYEDAELFYPDCLPDFVVAHIAYGIKRYDMAVKYFEKAVKIARKDKNNIPKITEAYLLIIKSYFSLNNKDGAKEFFPEFLCWLRESRAVVDEKEVSYLVEALLDNRFYDEVIAFYQYMLEFKDFYGTALRKFFYGNIFLFMNKHKNIKNKGELWKIYCFTERLGAVSAVYDKRVEREFYSWMYMFKAKLYMADGKEYEAVKMLFKSYAVSFGKNENSRHLLEKYILVFLDNIISLKFGLGDIRFLGNIFYYQAVLKSLSFLRKCLVYFLVFWGAILGLMRFDRQFFIEE